MEKQVELKKPKIRESNIELLRILAMIMIIAHHFACHSNFDFPLTEVTFNRVWIQFMHLGGKIGVDVFVLISGYFLINQKEIKVNKVLKTRRILLQETGREPSSLEIAERLDITEDEDRAMLRIAQDPAS